MSFKTNSLVHLFQKNSVMTLLYSKGQHGRTKRNDCFMSILDFIKDIFGGESRERAQRGTNVVEDKSANTEISVDKTPTLENVARFVIQKGICKGADIQRYFQIGYNLSGSLMSQLQKKGVLDNNYNVLIDVNISDHELTQLLNKDYCKNSPLGNYYMNDWGIKDIIRKKELIINCNNGEKHIVSQEQDIMLCNLQGYENTIVPVRKLPD